MSSEAPRKPYSRPSGPGRPGAGGPGGAPGGGRGGDRRPFARKSCRYCKNKDVRIDYKDAKALRPFLSERGKILPRRMSGNCAKHQREVCVALKRARALAIIPYAAILLERG